MNIRDELERDCYLFGEDYVFDNLTVGMIKQDNIECCVCLNYHWGVELPNCSHFICPKCYDRIYNGYISSEFYNEYTEPIRPVEPIYPYQNRDNNTEIFFNITDDDTYLVWFTDENQDLYNSVKMNSEYVTNLDVKIKSWFENNELLKIYDTDLIKYRIDLDKYYVDSTEYYDAYEDAYEDEKESNATKICPLCRL